MLDSQLKKLHQALEVMISARKGKCNLGHELLQLLSCLYFSVFSQSSAPTQVPL